MKKLMFVFVLFISVLFSCFCCKESEQEIVLNYANQINSIIKSKSYENLAGYIDDNYGLYITDNILMKHKYSNNLSKEMIANIQNDMQKYSIYVDDDPNDPAFITWLYYFEHRFPISQRQVEIITYNAFSSNDILNTEDTILDKIQDSIFVEYRYKGTEKYSYSDWLNIYYIFAKIGSDYKLVGLTRNYQ